MKPRDNSNVIVDEQGRMLDDPHTLAASQETGIPYHNITKLQRDVVKGFKQAQAYGMDVDLRTYCNHHLVLRRR